MKYIAASPRSMSAWMANLLTIPHQSLFLQDTKATPEVETLLDNIDVPVKGIIENYIDFYPDCVIIRDKGTVKQKTDKLLQTDTRDTIERIYEQLYSFDVPRYHIENMDDWIEELYEWMTGQTFDRARYYSLKNFYIEGDLARWIKSGD